MSSMTHYKAGYVAGTKASVDDNWRALADEYAHDAVQAPDMDAIGDEFERDAIRAEREVYNVTALWYSGFRAGLASGIRFIG